jgi:hypothetical protein
MLRMDVPIGSAHATHEDDGGMGSKPVELREGLGGEAEFGDFVREVSNPLLDFVARLLHECSHWQAIDESARPLGVER